MKRYHCIVLLLTLTFTSVLAQIGGRTQVAVMNWYAVNDSRNIAPAGWHVPTEEEWKQLEMHLGMSQSEVNNVELSQGTNEGDKLKETGTTHWNSPNKGATNESHFTALPGSYRDSDNGSFEGMGSIAFFWSATLGSSDEVWSH